MSGIHVAVEQSEKHIGRMEGERKGGPEIGGQDAEKARFGKGTGAALL